MATPFACAIIFELFAADFISSFSLHQMAGYKMTGLNLFQHWYTFPAFVAGHRAAAGESTSLWLMNGTGHIPFNDLTLLFLFQFRIGDRHSGKQRFGIWMQGVGIQFFTGGQLHHTAQIHDRNTIGNVFDYVQVVGNKQIS